MLRHVGAIVSGSTHRIFARDLAQKLSVSYIASDVQKFADGELRVQITNAVYGNNVAIVQSTQAPVHDNFMELLLLIDAVKRAGATSITAFVPYLCYSRQDRPSYEYGSISFALIARLLEVAGINRLITIDLHSNFTEAFFKINVQNINPAGLFARKITNLDNMIIVSPDTGGIERAGNLAKHLGVATAIIYKTREKYNVCRTEQLIGQVSGKRCVIVDDIIDTANTICEAAKLLIAHGAQNVNVFATHAVLSESAIQNIMRAPIEQIYITNSIITQNLPNKFEVIDLLDL